MAILIPPIFPQQMALPSRFPYSLHLSHTQTYFTLHQTNTAASLAETWLGAARSTALSFLGERPPKNTYGGAFPIPDPPPKNTYGGGPFHSPYISRIPTIPILTAAVMAQPYSTHGQLTLLGPLFGGCKISTPFFFWGRGNCQSVG